jgi:hypothetical protein
MKTQVLNILSKSLLAMGYASIAGSMAIYGVARSRNDIQMQNDALFVGLWVPSFFLLSNRYSEMALENQEKEELFLKSAEAQNTVQGRLTTNKNLPAGWADEVEEGAKSAPTQSPRPLQHTRNRQ